MIPVRGPRPDPDPFALRVFVPGIMVTGMLVSLAVLAADAVQRLMAGRGERRHARLAAGQVVASALAASGVARGAVRAAGVRSRAAYAGVAAGFLAVGIYTLVGSFWNFVNPSPIQNWVEDVAWVWAVSLAIGGTFVWVGTAAAAVAVRWPAVPAFAWPLLHRTPLGSGAEVRRATGAGGSRRNGAG